MIKKLKNMIETFKKFFVSSKFLESSVGTDHLYTLELKSVNNCFDGDTLWHRIYKNDNEIFESTTKNNNYRLKKALNDHMFETSYTDEKGNVKKKENIFSHVIVRIPESKYNQDKQDNGEKIIDLKNKLIELHDKDFKEKTFKNQIPHYEIVYHDDDDDKVIFQFGKGVFIPLGSDKYIGEIQIKKNNSKLQSLPKWIFWQQSGEEKRASNLYVGQEHIIISNNYKNASICVPGFFSSDDAWIHINCITGKVYGDGKHLLSEDSKKESVHPNIDNNNSKEYKLTEKIYGVNHHELSILKEENIVSLKWIIDDKLSAPCVYLAGYACMKLENIYWYICLDRDCMPCSESESNVTFCGNYDKVSYIPSDSEKKFDIDSEKKFDIEFEDGIPNIFGFEIRLPHEDLKDKYNLFLMIPYENKKTIAEIPADKPNLIGRSLTDNQQKSELEIALNPETVKNKAGEPLGHIGVSRKHAILKWQRSTDKFFIRKISESADLYILKTDNHVIQLKLNKEVEVYKNDKLIIGTFILEIGSQKGLGTEIY